MMALFSLVGRAGVEPATNGLKVLRARHAQIGFIGELAAWGASEPGFRPVSAKIPQPKAGQISSTVFKSGLSTCGTTETLAEPSLMRFTPLTRAQWSRTGNAAARAFAFQGRCFVMVNAQADAPSLGGSKPRWSADLHGPEALMTKCGGSAPATITKRRHPQGGH